MHHITRFVLTLHPEFDMEKHLDRFERTSRWRAPTFWLYLKGLLNISASYISPKIHPRKPQHHHFYQQKLRLFISVMAGSHICSKATALCYGKGRAFCLKAGYFLDIGGWISGVIRLLIHFNSDYMCARMGNLS